MVRPGMMISDRYEIIEKIGSGGMADVFRAKCHRLNRFVAIKFLKQEYCQDTKFVNKFRGEAQSVAGLSHPNIVSIFDVGEDQDLHYIVMEYIEGITLKKYINDRGKLTVKEAVGISLQIAAGLNAAHANNIIHRDIKPQNILISRDGTAKVTDFGIAKAASSNTITSNAMGSVHYISPEQARGGFSNEKSDIYSLGVTMYEMLSGRLPFTGESTVAIALAHIQDEATPLCELDPSIPVGLSNIVKKAMQKKQEMRYASAAAMMADLKMFLSDPTGDYGVVTPLTDTDSPTIFIKDDEMNEIRKSAHTTRIPANVEPEEEPEEEEEEEQDQSDVDPKLEKALVFGSIAVAIIIGLIIIFMLGKFIGLWGGSKPSSSPTATSSTMPEGMTTVPDVSNLKQDAAQTELQKAGLLYKVEDTEDDTYPEGTVISTDPVAGTKVAKNTTVVLKVSSGGEQLVVPDVTGETYDEAVTKIKAAGFTGTITKKTAYDDNTEVNQVAYTSPKANEKASKDSAITVYVSKGSKALVTVPNVVGKTKTNALTLLADAGLKVEVTTEYSDTVPNGQVIRQSLNANTQVQRDTKINITVSLGKQASNYKGSVTIENDNFYNDPSDPTETFTFKLVQDGKTTDIKTAPVPYAKFPYSLSVSSKSGNPGQVLVFLRGSQVASYTINNFVKQ